jgi:hypothetical protein
MTRHLILLHGKQTVKEICMEILPVTFGGGSRHHHLLEMLSIFKSKIGDPKNIDMPKKQKIK